MRSLPNFRLLDPTSQAAGFRGTSPAAFSTFDQENAQALDNQRMQQMFGQGQGQGLPYGNTPNYNGAGVMPPKGGGFEEYVAHHLSNRLGLSKDGRINNVLTGGRYAGMSYGEAYDKAREDYAALPDDQKREYESKAFLQNDRTSREHLYQTPEQSQRAGETDAQGNKIPTWQDIARGGGANSSLMGKQGSQNPSPATSQAPAGQAPAGPYQSSALTGQPPAGSAPAAPAAGVVPQPDYNPVANGRSSGSAQNQQTSFNPGSMGGSGSLADNDTREHYGMGDTDNRNGGGTHDAQANLPGQRYAGTLASAQPVVQPGPVPFTPRPMGNANDTAQFGPKLSGGGAAPVTSWSAPVAPASPSIPFQASASIRPAYTQPTAVAQPSIVPHPNYVPQPDSSSPGSIEDMLHSQAANSPAAISAAENLAGTGPGGTLSPDRLAAANADLAKMAATSQMPSYVSTPPMPAPARVVPQVGGQSAGPTGSPSVQPSQMPSYNAAPPAKPLVAPMVASRVVK